MTPRNLTLIVCLLAIVCLHGTQGAWVGWRRSWKPPSQHNEADPQTTTPQADPRADPLGEEDGVKTNPDWQMTSASPSDGAQTDGSGVEEKGDSKVMTEDVAEHKVCQLVQKIVAKAGCRRLGRGAWWTSRNRRCSRIRRLATKLARQFKGFRCDIDGADNDPTATTTTESPTTLSTTTESTTTTTPSTTTTTTTESTTTTTATAQSTTTPEFTCRGSGLTCEQAVGGDCPLLTQSALGFLSCPFPDTQVCCTTI